MEPSFNTDLTRREGGRLDPESGRGQTTVQSEVNCRIRNDEGMQNQVSCNSARSSRHSMQVFQRNILIMLIWKSSELDLLNTGFRQTLDIVMTTALQIAGNVFVSACDSDKIYCSYLKITFKCLDCIQQNRVPLSS